jgi:anti-sigma regulatory factor (Ser/Thr protein kinase)
VICTRCSDAVDAGSRCPTCGQADPLQPAAPPQTELDESLLNQVGVALRAQSALSRSTSEQRVETARRLFDEATVLNGRLRRQATLLRASVAEREARLQNLRDALGLVEEAMAHADAPIQEAASTASGLLPRDRSCPAVARRLLRQYAHDLLSPRELEDATVIASELATNAYLHGQGTIQLTLSRREDRLRIEVLDDGRPARIDAVPAGERAAGGRGLMIVEQLACDWGAVAGFGHVWAELPIGDH